MNPRMIQKLRSSPAVAEGSTSMSTPARPSSSPATRCQRQASSPNSSASTKVMIGAVVMTTAMTPAGTNWMVM